MIIKCLIEREMTKYNNNYDKYFFGQVPELVLKGGISDPMPPCPPFHFKQMVTLLVITIQGYWTKASWGFPKGKINQDEDASVCAAR